MGEVWSYEPGYVSMERKATTGKAIITDENGLFIASCIREDAPLIAAAPRLLAALQLAEKHIASTCDETSEADLPDWFADLRTIRAAIAAAEGEG